LRGLGVDEVKRLAVGVFVFFQDPAGGLRAAVGEGDLVKLGLDDGGGLGSGRDGGGWDLDGLAGDGCGDGGAWLRGLLGRSLGRSLGDSLGDSLWRGGLRIVF